MIIRREVKYTASDLLKAIVFIKDKETITMQSLKKHLEMNENAVFEIMDTLVQLHMIEAFTGENFKRKVLINN